jgi:two-component system LytT family response regulator
MPDKIKTLIIDDEKLARDIIKNYLNKQTDIEISGECSNGFEALKMIQDLKPEIIFLDIQMPKITGFEMLELMDDPPVIIFTTAYDQYALKAFEVNATDYLLKPFSMQRFNEALDKAKVHLKNRNEYVSGISKLSNNIQRIDEYLNRIIVKKNQAVIIIPVNNIHYIEAQDDYVMIYSEEGKNLKQKTMKALENSLDPNEFIRIHRSFIVNISRIQKLEPADKDNYLVKLKEGSVLPVSKSGYSRLRELLK